MCQTSFFFCQIYILPDYFLRRLAVQTNAAACIHFNFPFIFIFKCFPQKMCKLQDHIRLPEHVTILPGSEIIPDFDGFPSVACQVLHIKI